MKAQVKCVLVDVICGWKMTSFRALDGVTSFFSLKDLTNTRKQMRRSLSIGAGSLSIGRVLQCNGVKLEEAEDFKYVFVVNCVLESK